MISFHTLDNTAKDAQGQTAYQRQRFDLIHSTEGTRWTAYLDTHNPAIPTIGIGFNLRDRNILELVLSKFGVSNKFDIDAVENLVKARFSSDSALQSALSTKMAELKAQNKANRATFAFKDGAAGLDEMRSVFDTAVQIYDGVYKDDGTLLTPGRVDDWLAGIPPSKERAVLVSLSYNGLVNAGKSKNLRKAVLNGNRAEAWYQIRYESNMGSTSATPPKDAAGIAKRRYYESELFGLYDDPSNVWN